MDEQIKSRVARRVRELAEAKFPYVRFVSGPKEELRRALGFTDRRTMESRWTGEVPYDIAQLAVIADLLGVRVADLTAPDDE